MTFPSERGTERAAWSASRFCTHGYFPPGKSQYSFVKATRSCGRVINKRRMKSGWQETRERGEVINERLRGREREQVEAMAPRRLLLVGEGNFSFAAALSETLDPSTSLTATCLQHPTDLARDPVARENLQRLHERGSEATPSAKPRPASCVAQSGKGGHLGIQATWGLLLNVPRSFSESRLCA